MELTSILTGDIIDSKSQPTASWLEPLTSTLAKFGKEKQHWEIYRGDSFQLEIGEIETTLNNALQIKSSIKKSCSLDVRIAIGIGEKLYQSDRITQSNGSAFVRSGESFDQLKKSTLSIQTPSSKLDETLNLMFALAQLTINQWTQASAEIIHLALSQPSITQAEWAKILDIKQSTVSERLKRAGYEEIIKLEAYYKEKIKELKAQS